MYTEEQYYNALALYDACGSVTKVMTQLGYPSQRQTLYNWMARRKHLPQGHSTFRGVNTPEHPRHPSLQLKVDAIHRCFELGEDVQSVSDEIGYSTASIYQWRRKYIQEGRASLMKPPNERDQGLLQEGSSAATKEIAQLQAQMQDMQLEIDILKATLDVLKKDPGIDRTALKSQEKAAIVDALKTKYSLPALLEALHYARSSYFYRKKIGKCGDPYVTQKEQIKLIFEDNYRCYGDRRIYLALKNSGIRLSEKVIRRLMKQEQLKPIVVKKRAYSSYQGEITPAVPNVVQRNFHADYPNKK